MPNHEIEIHVSSRALTRAVYGIVGLLAIAGVISGVLRVCLGHDYGHGLVPLFRLDREANIPTWCSSMILAIAALALTLLAYATRSRGEPETRYWGALAAIFTLLSIDECAQLHELVGLWVHDRFHTTGVFYLAWTIPAVALVAVAGIGFLGFVRRLPRRTAARFVLAGALYVGAALGLELIESPIEERFGQENLAIALLTCVEEITEMAAIVLFVRAVLDHAAAESGGFRLLVTSE